MLSQSHGKHGDGYGQCHDDNQQGEVVDDGFHQLVITGRHLSDGSGKRAFGIDPPMKGVGEKRESEGNEAPADTFHRVVAFHLSENLGQSGQNNRSNDVSQIRFARYQEQDEDESVQGCCRPKATNEGAGIEVDKGGHKR